MPDEAAGHDVVHMQCTGHSAYSISAAHCLPRETVGALHRPPRTLRLRRQALRRPSLRSERYRSVPDAADPFGSGAREPACSIGSVAPASWLRASLSSGRLRRLPNGSNNWIRQRAFSNTQGDSEGSKRWFDGELYDPVPKSTLLEDESWHDAYTATQGDERQDRFMSFNLRVDIGRDRTSIEPLIQILPSEPMRREDNGQCRPVDDSPFGGAPHWTFGLRADEHDRRGDEEPAGDASQ